VDGILYFVSLDDYDQIWWSEQHEGSEEEIPSKLKDSLEIFRSITGSDLGKVQRWTVVLNKCDLFEKKIGYSKISRVFSGITDSEESDPSLAAMFVLSLFEKHFQGLQKFSYLVVNSLDTRYTNEAVEHIINQVNHKNEI